MNFPLIARAIFFTLVIPGTVTIYLPYRILGLPEIDLEFSTLRIAVFLVWLGGMGVLLHCIRGFVFFGGGTLAPVDPPKTLVVRGLYSYTRNPMYLSVLSILLAESLFFKSWDLLIYAGIVFGSFNLFVLLYEEPHLKKQFAQQYLDYCRTVPRWGVSLRLFSERNNSTDS